MTNFSDNITASLGEDLTSHIDVMATNHNAAFRSFFKVTELALASVQAAVKEYAALVQAGSISIDKRLALLSFEMTTRPIGWELGSLWDPIAGDYKCADGWVRLHTNAPHHQKAALAALGCDADQETVARKIQDITASEVEARVIAHQGCAAQMRSLAEWQAHPQGQAVAAEPLIHWDTREGDAKSYDGLKAVKVLDLTRVLAGPVGTRFLASFGADVLRIDPVHWNEPPVELEVTPGKTCAGLDLKSHEGRAVFERLLGDADLLVHGYRPDALASLGYDAEGLKRLNPNLSQVSLCAYGWSGPWSGRRGFDSLVQMSCGIADEGMKRSKGAKPTPLPVQALDFATGYMVAAAALRALHMRKREGRISSARLSLARTAQLLMSAGSGEAQGDSVTMRDEDFRTQVEDTSWGPARRLKFGYAVAGEAPKWQQPAGSLRRHAAKWADS